MTPRPAASFSSPTAVGLLSPRSISEIIDRLTPLLVASASSERPWPARSSRTRSAMRSFRSDAVAVSMMVDVLSTIWEDASTLAFAGAPLPEETEIEEHKEEHAVGDRAKTADRRRLHEVRSEERHRHPGQIQIEEHAAAHEERTRQELAYVWPGNSAHGPLLSRGPALKAR